MILPFISLNLFQYNRFKDKNEQITQEVKLSKNKDYQLHESISLEIEQWLFYFPQILKIIQESEKMSKQDNENTFHIFLEEQRYSMEEYINNEQQNNQIKVGYLHIKILKDSISKEQQVMINQIKQKSGQYLDHILSNKASPFVNYLFSEMEPEEKEYFTFYSLRDLLDQAYQQADQQFLKQIISMSKRNIVQSLKSYIKKFENEKLDLIENNDFIYHKYFLVGEQSMQRLFAETVDRTEMMFLKNCMSNMNKSYHQFNEIDSNDIENFENNKQNIRLKNQNQAKKDKQNENNNQNTFDSWENKHKQSHKENIVNNCGKQSSKDHVQDYFQAALEFLATNNSINHNQKQQQEVQLTQVDQSQLTVNKNINNLVEYQNKSYYLKKFNENQLQEILEKIEKRNQYFHNSFSLVNKVIQINYPKSNQENQFNHDKQQQNEFGILIEKKNYNLKQLIEEGNIFSVYQEVDIALKLVKYLNQIHQKRGAHCNLKTNNILFDTSYNMYLSDIGLDCKNNTLNHYQFENIYTNALNSVKNKLKSQFITQITESQSQKNVNINQNNQQTNSKHQNQHSNKQDDDNQIHHLQKQQLHSNQQIESQFKKAFQQQQQLFFNQLGDIQALGLILYQLFTGKCITAENYFLKNHRQYIKRISQESPTKMLKSIFSLIYSLLELQNTSTENIFQQLQDIYSNF